MSPMTANDIDRLDARAVIERWQLKRLGNQESTQKGYASVLRRFEAWCLRHGAVACPATSSTVDAFLSHIGCENVGSRYNVRKSIAAGHVFVAIIRNAFPINVLNDIKGLPEVCTVFCATANQVEVLVAETSLGRGVIGVVDGQTPVGVENDKHVRDRKEFLRRIGYKL